MGKKHFRAFNKSFELDKLNADYEQAELFDKLRVGKLGVFYRDGFATVFLAYSDFDRVFIRIHEVTGKLCCGKSTFQYFRVVFVREGKEIADLLGEDEKAFDAALECISSRCPDIAVGFVG